MLVIMITCDCQATIPKLIATIVVVMIALYTEYMLASLVTESLHTK